MFSILQKAEIYSVNLNLQKEGRLTIFDVFDFQSSELTFEISER